MTKYVLRLSSKFDTHRQKFEKADDKPALKKIEKLLEELKVHPRSGTGKPERLKGYGAKEIWSRRITDKHRLVYEIQNDVVIVLVLAAGIMMMNKSHFKQRQKRCAAKNNISKNKIVDCNFL